MPNNNQPNQLSKEQQKAIQEGNWLYEMTQTQGWKQVMVPMLEDRMRHAWIDPRECKDEKEFAYQEMGLFFARDAARQLLEDIYKKIEDGNAYTDIKEGKDTVGRMKL